VRKLVQEQVHRAGLLCALAHGLLLDRAADDALLQARRAPGPAPGVATAGVQLAAPTLSRRASARAETCELRCTQAAEPEALGSAGSLRARARAARRRRCCPWRTRRRWPGCTRSAAARGRRSRRCWRASAARCGSCRRTRPPTGRTWCGAQAGGGGGAGRCARAIALSMPGSQPGMQGLGVQATSLALFW